jgi:hypothetical protein
VLGEFFWGCLQKLSAEATRRAHAFTFNGRAGIPPERQSLRRVFEINADFLKNRLRVVLDQRQRFLVQYVKIRDTAINVGDQRIRS